MTVVIAFFVLAFGVSWSVWLPVAGSSRGWLAASPDPTITGLIGAFGPTLAALLVLAARRAWGELRHLVGAVCIWQVGPGWYAFALLWPAAHSLLITAVSVGMGAPAPDFSNPPATRVLTALPAEAVAGGPWPLLPVLFLQNLLLGSAMGEEPGWRGFALPRLLPRYGAAKASSIVGLLWGVWHLPLFMTVGHPLAQLSFSWFLVGIVGESVLYTWLLVRTRGSLLLVLLLHAATATTTLFLAAADDVSPTGAIVTWSVSLCVLRWGGISHHPQRVVGSDGLLR